MKIKDEPILAEKELDRLWDYLSNIPGSVPTKDTEVVDYAIHLMAKLRDENRRLKAKPSGFFRPSIRPSITFNTASSSTMTTTWHITTSSGIF